MRWEPGSYGGHLPAIAHVLTASAFRAGKRAAEASALPRARGRARLTRRLLVGADLVGVVLAFAASRLAMGVTAREVVVFVLCLPLWPAAGAIAGLYDRDGRRPGHSTADELPALCGAVTAGTWLFCLVAFAAGAVAGDAPRLAAFWLPAIVLVAGARTVARALARRRPQFAERALIVGSGDLGRVVARKLERHPELGIEVLGFVDEVERVPEVVEALRADRVVVTVEGSDMAPVLDAVQRLRARAVHVDVVPSLLEALDPRSELHALETLPLIGLPPARHARVPRLCKRVLDLTLAGAALALASPLLAVIAWRVKRDSPGPVFFRQTRLGLNMRPFTALKFRTMRVGADDASHRDYIRASMSADAESAGNGLYKLERRDDVTPFGRFLRRTSLDELPQLINVVRGEMSLVGPRPCIPYETEHFAPHHFERFLVPAGLTGLWQVAARARATFGEQLEMDVAYARGWSLGLDLRLLCKTPLVVLRQAATA